jgi:hypothetical protein
MNLIPRYTDSHRYLHGYHTACDTNIAKTFERIRKELADQAGPKDNVAPIKPHLRAA